VTQNLIAWFGKMLAVKELVRRPGHNALEQRLALGERSRTQIDAIEMQKTEGVVAQVIQLFRRQSVLQTVKGKGAVIRQVNHFAVVTALETFNFAKAAQSGLKRSLQSFAARVKSSACRSAITASSR
jgi:hypothetical protein